MLTKNHIIQIFFFILAIIYLSRLFYLQIITDEYKSASDKNTIQKKIENPYRGEIYDRNNKLLVYNEPSFDLMIKPSRVKNIDINLFCKIFEISKEEYQEKLKKAKLHSKIKPSLFLRNISNIEFVKIQEYISEFPGFFFEARTTRGYLNSNLANVIGYLSEANNNQLKKSKYYKIGDQMGINGIEKHYEKYLRGEKGISYKIVDANGMNKGRYQNGKLDIPSVPGKNIKLTIDVELQKYGDYLMQNKRGSIIVIEPKTGEILVMATYPSYDPNLIKGRKFQENFKKLQNDAGRPLFPRPYMSTQPFGSIFKIVQTVIGLQEGVIAPSTTFVCNTQLLKCHQHKSPLNLYEAVQYSCNPYYYFVFRKILNQDVVKSIYADSRIGFKKWYNYVKQFGFGEKLMLDIPGEQTGYIPTTEYYDKIYGKGRWKTSTIRSLDIGQGEMLATPLQMVNLAVIFANYGYYYQPHLVKEIDSKPLSFPKHEIKINPKHFKFVVDAMSSATSGTARRALIDNIKICCKTGTAENPHGDDHSVFIAFAPFDDPKIAIAVYVENAGWGGIAAASVGSLIIEKYLNGEISKRRKSTEKTVLELKPQY